MYFWVQRRARLRAFPVAIQTSAVWYYIPQRNYFACVPLLPVAFIRWKYLQLDRVQGVMKMMRVARKLHEKPFHWICILLCCARMETDPDISSFSVGLVRFFARPHLLLTQMFHHEPRAGTHTHTHTHTLSSFCLLACNSRHFSLNKASGCWYPPLFSNRPNEYIPGTATLSSQQIQGSLWLGLLQPSLWQYSLNGN